MNGWFISAGILTGLVALFHSLLGELLIFRHPRWLALQGLPTDQAHFLRRRGGILWATWHVTTVFGLVLAALLIGLGWVPGALPGPLLRVVVGTVALGLVLASLLVALGTKARHPGWVGLLAAALLIGLGHYA